MKRHSVMELFLLIDEQRQEILELHKENAKLEAELQELKLKKQPEMFGPKLKTEESEEQE